MPLSSAQSLLKSLSKPNYRPLFEKHGKTYGVDPDLLEEMAKWESNLDPFAVSPAGAKGLMQLMDQTAESLNVKNSFDPDENVRAGAELMSQLLKQFEGDKKKALAAYNAGLKWVRQAEKEGEKWFESFAQGAHAEERKGYAPGILKRYNKRKGIKTPKATVAPKEDVLSSAQNLLSSLKGFSPEMLRIPEEPPKVEELKPGEPPLLPGLKEPIEPAEEIEAGWTTPFKALGQGVRDIVLGFKKKIGSALKNKIAKEQGSKDLQEFNKELLQKNQESIKRISEDPENQRREAEFAAAMEAEWLPDFREGKFPKEAKEAAIKWGVTINRTLPAMLPPAMYAVEAGSFLDEAERVGITDPEILETFSTAYGMGSGALEGVQGVIAFGPMAKVLKKVPKADKVVNIISGKVLNLALKGAKEIGLATAEGLTEVSQAALMAHILGRAAKAQGLDPKEIEGKINKNYKDDFIAGFGMGMILRGTGKAAGKALDPVAARKRAQKLLKQDTAVRKKKNEMAVEQLEKLQKGEIDTKQAAAEIEKINKMKEDELDLPFEEEAPRAEPTAKPQEAQITEEFSVEARNREAAELRKQQEQMQQQREKLEDDGEDTSTLEATIAQTDKAIATLQQPDVIEGLAEQREGRRRTQEMQEPKPAAKETPSEAPPVREKPKKPPVKPIFKETQALSKTQHSIAQQINRTEKPTETNLRAWTTRARKTITQFRKTNPGKGWKEFRAYLGRDIKNKEVVGEIIGRLQTEKIVGGIKFKKELPAAKPEDFRGKPLSQRPTQKFTPEQIKKEGQVVPPEKQQFQLEEEIRKSARGVNKVKESLLKLGVAKKYHNDPHALFDKLKFKLLEKHEQSEIETLFKEKVKLEKRMEGLQHEISLARKPVTVHKETGVIMEPREKKPVEKPAEKKPAPIAQILKPPRTKDEAARNIAKRLRNLQEQAITKETSQWIDDYLEGYEKKKRDVKIPKELEQKIYEKVKKETRVSEDPEINAVALVAATEALKRETDPMKRSWLRASQEAYLDKLEITKAQAEKAMEATRDIKSEEEFRQLQDEYEGRLAEHQGGLEKTETLGEKRDLERAVEDANRILDLIRRRKFPKAEEEVYKEILKYEVENKGLTEAQRKSLEGQGGYVRIPSITEAVRAWGELKSDIRNLFLKGKIKSQTLVGDLYGELISQKQVFDLKGHRAVYNLRQKVKDNLELELIPFIIEKTGIPPKLKRPDLEKLYDKVKSRPEDWKRLNEAARIVEKWNDQVFDYLRKNYPKFSSHERENYVTHIWGVAPKNVDAAVNWLNKFMTVDPHLKKRFFKTYFAGIEQGWVPQDLRVDRIMNVHTQYATRTTMHRKFIEALKVMEKHGVPLLIPESKMKAMQGGLDKKGEPIAYVVSDHPSLAEEFTDTAGKKRTERLAYHKDLDHVMRVLFEPRKRNRLIKALETAVGVIKKLNLSFALFHHWALTETASAISPKLALKVMFNFKEGYRTAIKGKQKMYEGDMWGTTQDAVEHGLSVHGLRDVYRGRIQAMLEDAERKLRGKLKPLRLAVKGIRKANQIWDAGLWDYYHNNLKLYGYQHLVNQQKAKNPNMTTAQEKVMKTGIAKFVNDTFGGQNLERLMVNERNYQWAQWLLLSPDWTYSTFWQALSPTGMGSISKLPAEKALRRRIGMAYWARAALIYGTGINLLNIMYRGWDEKEEYEKRLTRLQQKKNDLMNRKRLSPFTSAKERMSYKKAMDERIAKIDQQMKELDKPNLATDFWKWTMLSNSPGNETYLFTGRYVDGKERYLRFGKQFRELFELFYIFNKNQVNPLLAAPHKLAQKASPALNFTAIVFGGQTFSGFEPPFLKDDMGELKAWRVGWALAASSLPFSTQNIISEREEKGILKKLPGLIVSKKRGATEHQVEQVLKVAIQKNRPALVTKAAKMAKLNKLNYVKISQNVMREYQMALNKGPIIEARRGVLTEETARTKREKMIVAKHKRNRAIAEALSNNIGAIEDYLNQVVEMERRKGEILDTE